MFNKKYIMILLLLIVSICAISTASAADNATDTVATDDADAEDIITNIDEDLQEATADDEVAAVENDEDKEVLASADEPALSQDQSSDVLSAYPVPSNFYSIKFTQQAFQVPAKTGGVISFDLTVCPFSGYYKYNFYMEIYDLGGKMLTQYQYYSTTETSDTYEYTIDPKEFIPGTYLVVARNVYDNNIMDHTALAVSGTGVIEASDYNSIYNSGAMMTAKIKDKDTGSPIKYVDIHVVFTDGKKTVTKTYKTDANGQISFVPPVGVGKWYAGFVSGHSWISTSAVTKIVTISKAPVKVKAYKVTEYKGYKTTLKAKVTSNGRNVNDGTVTFKINGKKYKAAVQNGFATVKVNLKKIKTYKYTAKFSSSNFKASKAAKGKATLKKSYKTKITAKDCKVFIFKKKTAKIIIKTKEGKKVKNGKVKITVDGQTIYANVKNGVAKLALKGLHAVDHFKGFTSKGETYKKYISKKVKVTFIPSTHKYRSSSAKIKVTSVYKCPTCGKTKSHYHWGHDSYYRPYKHFYAIV